MKTFTHYINYSILIVCFICTGCVSTALFDQHSFDQTINAKVETLGLMKRATDEYSVHKELVSELQEELEKVYEYDKRRTHNDISTMMWKVILDEERNSVAGFFKKWREGGPQNKAFITEAALQIEQAFDLLLDFENAKSKSESDDIGALILSFISNI